MKPKFGPSVWLLVRPWLVAREKMGWFQEGLAMEGHYRTGGRRQGNEGGGQEDRQHRQGDRPVQGDDLPALGPMKMTVRAIGLHGLDGGTKAEAIRTTTTVPRMTVKECRRFWIISNRTIILKKIESWVVGGVACSTLALFSFEAPTAQCPHGLTAIHTRTTESSRIVI